MLKYSVATFTHIQLLMITLITLFGSAFALSSGATEEPVKKANLIPPIDKTEPLSHETATFGLG